MRIILFISFSFVMTFSVLAEQWHQKANFGGIGRHRATGISIGNKGYIGLGHVNGSGIDISYNDWWQFDPASNSWTQKANYPTVNHGAVGFGTSTKGYVGGGSYLGGEFYCYDPEMNTWTPIATCPTTPGDVQCFSIQNKGYIIYSTELYEYDPLTNTWSSKADCPVSVTTWASSFSTESSGFVKTLSSLYEYKPASDTWLQRTPFPGLMSGGAAAFESDNKGYFICGFSGALSTVTNEIWEFNPGNNQWMRIGFFPGTSRRFPVAFSINNKGYFGTGTNGINMNDFWEYNPEFAELSELNDYKVTVYPNPSIDVVNFVSQNENSTYIDESKVELFSIDGKLLIQENFSSHGIAIKIDHLQKGNYLYRILNKGQIIQTGNIIKN